ncbi:hypothetical protein ACOMHN_061548 [Nucella lapillus]
MATARVERQWQCNYLHASSEPMLAFVPPRVYRTSATSCCLQTHVRPCQEATLFQIPPQAALSRNFYSLAREL